jgi:hypothetical protein|tara:strand:+ start:79 stop:696 length:618 start_codon:yes stop_codon:yes gene_type:complete
MKKLFLYIFLGLLLCNVGYTKVVHLKCTYTKVTNYTAYGGKLEKQTRDISPVWEMVYSIDLDKEIMIGKNYKIWDSSETPKESKYDTHVFEDKIIWIDKDIVEHKQKVFVDVYGQKAVSAYNYNEINRYNGEAELSMYSQEYRMGKLFHENYDLAASSENKKIRGLNFIHKINKIAKENRKQKDNILVNTSLGSCDKMEKLDKKF